MCSIQIYGFEYSSVSTLFCVTRDDYPSDGIGTIWERSEAFELVSLPVRDLAFFRLCKCIP